MKALPSRSGDSIVRAGLEAALPHAHRASLTRRSAPSATFPRGLKQCGYRQIIATRWPDPRGSQGRVSTNQCIRGANSTWTNNKGGWCGLPCEYPSAERYRYRNTHAPELVQRCASRNLDNHTRTIVGLYKGHTRNYGESLVLPACYLRSETCRCCRWSREGRGVPVFGHSNGRKQTDLGLFQHAC